MPDLVAHFLSLGPWAWIIAGAILLALELAVPGAFMMWLGIAATLVGAVSFVVAWSWQWQCVAFEVFALASVPLWRRFAPQVAPSDQAPMLNRRTEALVGRIFTLEKPIVDGIGTVRIDDTIWRVHGSDRDAGSRVRVTRAEGASLTVEAAS